MSDSISPYAGLLPTPNDLVDLPRLLHAYEADQPDPAIKSQRVCFGTSGHRGSSLRRSFNKNHILAITQAICDYRKKLGITGPIFLGFDTHALSQPAFQTAMEVLAGNDAVVMIAVNDEFTPTPVISHAVLCYNGGKTEGFADGIVITPSHNPPDEGGFKYNPPHGGPAGEGVTKWIQDRANAILVSAMNEVKMIPFARAIQSSTTHRYDFLNSYIRDLGNIVDLDIIRESGIKMGVDPMGGAGVHYWQPIAELYKINLSVVNTTVDPCFRFMPRDWDGKIRMDPSSIYAMQSLIKKRGSFDISFACDTDHDRHGIVTKKGLMPPNHYLASAVFYLIQNRPLWSTKISIGKTLVSSQMIDRVAAKLERAIFEVPVGFKWFVDGLFKGELGFAGEESAGAIFLRKNGKVWTTDKDGIVPALLSAELSAKLGKDPALLYEDIAHQLGETFYERVQAPATSIQKAALNDLESNEVELTVIGGDKIQRFLKMAPGNHAPIGGAKIRTKNGWIALRPSGTEDIYKIYGESFRSSEHLASLLDEGRKIASHAFQETKPDKK